MHDKRSTGHGAQNLCPHKNEDDVFSIFDNVNLSRSNAKALHELGKGREAHALRTAGVNVGAADAVPPRGSVEIFSTSSHKPACISVGIWPTEHSPRLGDKSSPLARALVGF